MIFPTVRLIAMAACALAGMVRGATPVLAQRGPWALTNARIETVSRGVIERGTVLIRNGLIEAVGPDLPIPPDALVLDLAGRTVSPGLIDLTSTLGLRTAPAPSPQAVGSGPQAAPAGEAARRAGVEPHRLVADEVRPSAGDIRAAREAGLTAVLVSPERGLFRGLSALIPLRDSANRSAIIRSPVAEHIGYEGIIGGEYPGSLLGVIAFQRQMLFDAERHGLLLDRWQSSPRGMTRPANDPALDALVPVVRGRLPVFLDAGNENEIRRAHRLAVEHGLALTVVGAVEGWRAVDALRGHGVAVSVNYPRTAQVTGWSYRGGLRRAPGDSAALDAAARKLIEGNAAALHAVGIRFALTSGGVRASEFLPNVRKAVAAGLPAPVALEAMTLRAAELAGVDAMLGSIEPGKIANLVVTTVPILSDSARITLVFVDGEQYRVTAPAARPVAGAAGAESPAQMGGTWTITTNSPQGTTQSTLTVTQQGTAFSGTMSSQMGTAQVADGEVTGRRITWTLVLSFGGQSLTMTFSGEVDGARMTGTVTAGDFGSFSFSGERQP